MKNLTIITINFGNTGPTEHLLESIEDSLIPFNLNIIIVDNGSTARSKKNLLRLKEKSKLQIQLFFNSENKYYWPAANKIILEKIKEKKKLPEWIIICNNDTKIKNKNFFKELSNINNNEFYVIGPKILNQKKKNLNPFMIDPLSKLQRIYWNLYFSSFYISEILNFLRNIKLFQKTRFYPDLKKEVYAVHGSMMIFSKLFFLKGGYLDTQFKMYCEEMSTAEIVKKIGGKIIYIPQLEAIHNEHSSIQKIKRKTIFELAKESHKYFIQKYLNN